MKATERDLKIINGMAGSNFTADDVEIFAFKAIGDRPVMDKIVITEKAMRQFETQAKKGVPLMINHAWKDGNNAYPYGRSFDARLIDGEGEGETKALEILFYIPKDVSLGDINTNDVIRSVKTGLLIEASIGFTYKKARCSICGKEDCKHFVGETYDNKKCFREVTDADLFEMSLVYSPAYKGARVTGLENGKDKSAVEEEVKALTGLNYGYLSATGGLNIQEKEDKGVENVGVKKDEVITKDEVLEEDEALEKKTDNAEKNKVEVEKETNKEAETEIERAEAVKDEKVEKEAESTAVSDVPKPKDENESGVFSIDGEEVDKHTLEKFYTLGKKMFYEKVEEAKQEAVRAIPDVDLEALALGLEDASMEVLEKKIEGYKALQIDIPTGRKTEEHFDISIEDDYRKFKL